MALPEVMYSDRSVSNALTPGAGGGQRACLQPAHQRSNGLAPAVVHKFAIKLSVKFSMELEMNYKTIVCYYNPTMSIGEGNTFLDLFFCG